jgi:starch synthase
MKILIAASDLTALISPDASATAAAIPALPVALQRAGHEISVAAPLIPALEKPGALKIKPTGVNIKVQLGQERVSVQVQEAKSAQGLQLFLFRDERFSALPADQPVASAMGAAAATLFSKLVVELARRLNPAPDIVQIQDWPGALVPVFLKAHHLPFTSVLAVSDPAAHGSFPIEDFGLLNLGWEYFRPTAVEFYGRVNFLKAGLVSATAVVTEGELELQAVQTSAQGGGLDVVFREQASHLHGIPAGYDEQVWNPAVDTHLTRRYRPASLAGKTSARNGLLSQLSLDKNPVGPVYLIDNAAGQDMDFMSALAARLDQLLAADVRVIVLGEFPPAHRGTDASHATRDVAVSFQIAARKHPGKLALAREVDDRLAHLALAGSDYQIFLGRPRGLSARLLRSLKYGTVPILPAATGVKQLVEDYKPGTESGCGLLFYKSDGAALFDVLAHRAPALLEPPDAWENLRQRAMIHAGKFSWARTAVQYGALYEQLKR